MGDDSSPPNLEAKLSTNESTKKAKTRIHTPRARRSTDQPTNKPVKRASSTSTGIGLENIPSTLGKRSMVTSSSAII